MHVASLRKAYANSLSIYERINLEKYPVIAEGSLPSVPKYTKDNHISVLTVSTAVDGILAEK